MEANRRAKSGGKSGILVILAVIFADFLAESAAKTVKGEKFAKFLEKSVTNPCIRDT